MTDEINKEAEYPETPELDKMAQFTDRSQAVGEFLDWLLGERDIVFAKWPKEREEEEEDDFADDWPKDRLIPECVNLNMLLAEYFDVDLVKVENERRAILAYLREKHEEKPAPSAKITITAGDDVEEHEIKGDPIG